MTQNSYNRKSHSSTIAKGVAHEDFRRELIKFQQSQCAKEERNHNRNTVHMIVNGVQLLLALIRRNVEVNLNNIVNQNKAADDKTLPHFDSVDSRVDIDCVCAENSNISHVEMVDET